MNKDNYSITFYFEDLARAHPTFLRLQLPVSVTDKNTKQMSLDQIIVSISDVRSLHRHLQF